MSNQAMDERLKSLCERRLTDAKQYLAQLLQHFAEAEKAASAREIKAAWQAFVLCAGDADGMHANFMLAETALFEHCADEVGLGHLKSPAQTASGDR